MTVWIHATERDSWCKFSSKEDARSLRQKEEGPVHVLLGPQEGI